MGFIRFILALSVVIAHSGSIFGLSIVGNQTAVQSFYIISGFYMSLILNEKYIHQNNSYKLFITNRFLRLYPVYWVVLLLIIIYSIAISIYSKGAHHSYLGIYITHFQSMDIGAFILLLIANVFIFLQDLVMFLGLDIISGNMFFTSDFQNTDMPLYRFLLIPQAWTIAVELSFYLIAPFILRRNIKLIMILIFLSLVLRILLFRSGLDHDPWTYRFFPAELIFFLLGNISYRIYDRIRAKEIKPLYLNLIFCFILCFTLLYSLFSFPGQMYFYFTCFFIALPFIFYHTKKLKTDAYFGELSYPIYISHLFVLTLVNILKIPIPAGIGLTLALSTILFSILLNEFVAKKIEVYRQKRLR